MDATFILIMLNNLRKQKDLKWEATCLYNIIDTAKSVYKEDFNVEFSLLLTLSEQNKLQK